LNQLAEEIRGASIHWREKAWIRELTTKVARSCNTNMFLLFILTRLPMLVIPARMMPQIDISTKFVATSEACIYLHQMHKLDVVVESFEVAEGLLTVRAFVAHLTRMNYHMPIEIVLGDKFPAAPRARKIFRYSFLLRYELML
ncbi:hypothetical protein PMAYCL1PPCAC_27957, partial [Pristionchus mayeri]